MKNDLVRLVLRRRLIGRLVEFVMNSAFVDFGCSRFHHLQNFDDEQQELVKLMLLMQLLLLKEEEEDEVSVENREMSPNCCWH